MVISGQCRADEEVTVGAGCNCTVKARKKRLALVVVCKGGTRCGRQRRMERRTEKRDRDGGVAQSEGLAGSREVQAQAVVMSHVV